MGRIDPEPTPAHSTAAPSWDPVKAPRITGSVGYTYTSFGRLLQGSDEVPDEEAQVDVHLWTVGLSGSLASGTTVGVWLPVGISNTSFDPEADQRMTGLADLTVFGSQDLGRILWSKESAFGLGVRVAMTFPTGRYEPETNVQVSELQTTNDGGLDVVLFDTRTSLGADVFAFGAGVQASLQTTDWLALMTDLEIGQPLNETRDDIFWGTDLRARLGASAVVLAGRLSLGLAADVLHHTQDRVPSEDDPSGRAFFGGRDEVGVAARVDARFHRLVGCGLNGRIPVVQNVGAIQLVESWSVGTSCTLFIGFGS